MSLKSPGSLASLLLLALGVAALSASCGGSEPRSTVAPSSVAVSTQASSDGSARATATSDDFTDEGDEEADPSEPTPAPAPAPAPEPEPAPAPTPAPAPGPAPAPAPASPWTPGTDPGPFPAPPRTTPGERGPIYWTPSQHKLVKLRINPDPVPFSGVAVPTAGCRELPHTWYYEQVIHAETGRPFRLTERENYFDGRLVSRVGENINVEGNGTHRLSSRWCSSFGNAHTAQHRFKGKDDEGNDIIVNGPLVQLQQNPHYVPPPPAPASQTQRSRGSVLLVWGD